MTILHSFRFYLVWSWTVLIFLVLAARKDDDEYVELYGHNRFESGVWKVITTREIGDDKLKSIAQQAHRQAGKGTKSVSLAVAESRWLEFYDSEKYPFIKIDVLVYAIEGYVKNDTGIPYFFYITKGLQPDCVYYLKKEDLEAMSLTLDKHVCGITM